MRELKACPFCGGTAEIATVTRHVSDNLVVVRCTRCRASTKTFHENKAEQAVSAWNERVK
jgi:Lar family restriction alleviation protein